MNAVDALMPYSFKVHFNISLPVHVGLRSGLSSFKIFRQKLCILELIRNIDIRERFPCEGTAEDEQVRRIIRESNEVLVKVRF
jgi:hypothetical protein